LTKRIIFFIYIANGATKKKRAAEAEGLAATL
jgi:hypothetical protein